MMPTLAYDADEPQYATGAANYLHRQKRYPAGAGQAKNMVRWLCFPEGCGVMGLTLGPVFDKKFPEDDLFSKFSADGKFLLDGMSRFDEICTVKNVPLFSTLCGPDEDEMEAMAEELEEELSLIERG